MQGGDDDRKKLLKENFRENSFVVRIHKLKIVISVILRFCGISILGLRKLACKEEEPNKIFKKELVPS